jgi:hypothetical protein
VLVLLMCVIMRELLCLQCQAHPSLPSVQKNGLPYIYIPTAQAANNTVHQNFRHTINEAEPLSSWASHFTVKPELHMSCDMHGHMDNPHWTLCRPRQDKALCLLVTLVFTSVHLRLPVALGSNNPTLPCATVSDDAGKPT